MLKAIEIKKNITTMGWLKVKLSNTDFTFLCKTLEELIYLAVLEAQAFANNVEGQGAYRIAIVNSKDQIVTRLEFKQAILDADPKQRQLANLATIGAIAKEKAALVLTTNSYKTGHTTNLLASVQMKDFGCNSQLGKDAIEACVNQLEGVCEFISWEKMDNEMLLYQQYLLPIS